MRQPGRRGMEMRQRQSDPAMTSIEYGAVRT
jgi:hypothetical protein